jgi:competence protein ComEC
MKRPLTGLVVTYASGIWVGSLAEWPVPVLCYAAAGLLVAFLLLHRTQFTLPVLLALVFAAGILAYRHATTNSSPDHITRLLQRRDQNVVVRGTIISDTGYRDETAEDPTADRLRFVLALEALKRAGQWRAATGKLLVFISANRPPQTLRYGDSIECSALLRLPAPARNPGTFDWRAWLARRNIQFTATIRNTDSCFVRARGGGNPLTALSLRLREQFERALRLGLEDEPKLAGVLAGMVIGQRSEIPPETYADFQHTGVFHVFAISGLHVGMVTAVVIIALRLVRVPRRWCGLMAIPLLILYVFATGSRPGAVRALVMACLWLISWMLVRPGDALSTLAAAALLILAFDPPQMFDGGFILSFTVVTSLVVLGPGLEAWLRRFVEPDPLLPGTLVPKWRRGIEGSLTWGVRLVSCSLAAWIGLLPLMAVYFHLFTPVSILANVLVIPLLGFIIALGMVAMVVQGVWPWLTLTFNNANFFLLGLMTRGVEWLGSVPYGHQFVQTPPAWLVAAFYAAGALLLAKRISWQRRRLAAAIVVPALGAALIFAGWRKDSVELTVLDLSDGASIFLNLPGERNDVVIDGGTDWSGRRVLVPFLRAQGVDRLKAVVLTRADKAHAAGLSALVAEIPAGGALHSGIASRSKFYTQWLESMRRSNVSLGRVRAGDRIELGNGCVLRVLHPQRGRVYDRSDDNALVLAVEHGRTRVLLMSDAGETVERELLKAPGDLRAHLIVKGRHGKEPSCTAAFLEAVQPDAVVAVVNVRPSGRYIEPGLRDRLKQRGVPLYRTDETGAVMIRLTATGCAIRTWLGPDLPVSSD